MKKHCLVFEVLTVVTKKITVFQSVMLCSLVNYCYSKFINNFCSYDRCQVCDAMGCTILWIADFVAALFFGYFSICAILLSLGLPFLKIGTLFGRVG